MEGSSRIGCSDKTRPGNKFTAGSEQSGEKCADRSPLDRSFVTLSVKKLRFKF